MKIKKNGFGLSFLLALGISFTAIFFTVLFPSLFKKSTSLGKEKLSSINKKVYSIPIINPIDSLLSDFNYEIIIQDSSENSFNGFSDNYQEDSSQILCFRGDEGRRNPTRGIIKSKPSKIFVDWKFETKTSNEWGGGSGWTGQPLLVCWSKDMKIQLGILDTSFINNDKAMEGIVGSLSGEIYFFDISNGKETRSPLVIDGPIKGTPSVDPRMNGILYVGQGIGEGKRFGAYVLDMINRKELLYIPGVEKDASRSWGAFDSNPLVDRKSGIVIWPGENGLIYKIDCSDKLNVHVVSKFKYNTAGFSRKGIESSAAVLGKYGFFADNTGNLFCLDLVTFKPKWFINNFDDTDASLVLDREENNYYLYLGNEVDHRKPEALSKIRKINVVTGQELWNWSIMCSGYDLRGKANSGGMLATPLLGLKNCEDLVFSVFSRTNGTLNSECVAVSKKTGKKIYTVKMDGYSWSSPVGIYDKKGNMYVFFSDIRGGTYLIYGKTGEIIYKEKYPYLFESSPIVYNNQIIVGVRGKTILGFKII